MTRRMTPALAATLLLLPSCGSPQGARQPAPLEPKSPATGAITRRYDAAARRIINATLADNDALDRLAYLCDSIGHRLSGSPGLAKAIDWALATMRSDGQDNVHPEKVMVPKWVRGEEWIRMVEPRPMDLPMLGLGLSVGTPPLGITAPVICVEDEEQFAALGDTVVGKIVLFNNAMQPYNRDTGSRYGQAVRFRGKGPRIAAARGAAACLVRSVTATSLRSPHTGATSYKDAPVKIPAAAITTEDADMIARLLERGEHVVVTLKMNARNEGMVPSANVIGELRGTTWPDEVVIISGHFDSWDVGCGAHDDGGACVAAMEAIHVLRKLGMVPRRTIRVVLWTNEESGLNGGRQYAADHETELANHIAALESDGGTFAPRGLGVECNDPARQAVAVRQLGEILRLCAPISGDDVSKGWSGADISPMRPGGVILMGLRTENAKYFDYHHSLADTLDKIDPDDLTACVAAMAVVSYVIADMPWRLGDEMPNAKPPAAKP